MANPIIKIKRSAVAGKIPTTTDLQLGELAINTYDGKVYIEQDQGAVGVGTTIVVINPWSVGTGTNTYNTYFTVGSVGVGSTIPTSKLHVVGDALVTGIVTASSGFVGGLTGNVTGNINSSGISTFATISAANVSVSGVVTFQSNVHLGDNDSLYFGDSNDLEIYHSGGNSFIVDAGTGNLVLGSNGDRISFVKGTGSETLARFNVDDSVELWFNNSKKFETTGYGATVFGTLQSQQLNVTGVSTFATVSAANINASGIVTASGGFNLGISSAGTTITSGPIKTLNFVGSGNTFAVNGTTVDISISGGGGGSNVSISTVAPSSPTAGALWYNSNLARTFIYYNDGSSSQWVDISPFNQGANSTVTVSPSAPTSPKEGQLWYSTNLARTFIYYGDGTSSQWVDASPFNTQTVNKTLTIGTRTTAVSLTLVGTGLTISLRSGVGTASF